MTRWKGWKIRKWLSNKWIHHGMSPVNTWQMTYTRRLYIIYTQCTTHKIWRCYNTQQQWHSDLLHEENCINKETHIDYLKRSGGGNGPRKKGNGGPNGGACIGPTGGGGRGGGGWYPGGGCLQVTQQCIQLTVFIIALLLTIFILWTTNLHTYTAF